MKRRKTSKRPTEVLLMALPQTAGSSLYGMLDVLSVAGNVWQTLTRSGNEQKLFRVRVVAPTGRPFTCGNGIPVSPDCSVSDDPFASLIVVPELWLGPDESIEGRYPSVVDWLRRSFEAGASLYSACSGSVLLAETGLLDGRAATSHWGYQDLFRKQYPEVRFDPAPNLCYADTDGRIVTAGGVTSWHDLAMHIIAKHANPGEALKIAKVYLLKWHGEGDLPYANLVRRPPHSDSLVRRCEDWLQERYTEHDAVVRVAEFAAIPERTLKRRFKRATGSPLIQYVQNLRVEAAKRLLENTDLPIEDISERTGYSDASFFRRLFKRLTGLTPGHYRRYFQPVLKDAAAGNLR
jgi:transcriptional regulator GlxA family with amidase domain